jgi:TonB-dependent receptor
MRYLLSILLLCFASAVSYAQTYSLSGVLYDRESGEYIIGESVLLLPDSIYASSDENGRFQFENLKAGNYAIEVKSDFYESIRQEILLNENKEIKISLLASAQVLDALTIVGKMDKESDMMAIRRERESDNVIQAVSSKTMEASPDVTVANVSQRVSGLSLERSGNGDGRYVIIRGMDQRYNNTLVNGVKIPSPDAKNRFVPLDIFPSEMLQRLEVYKTLTPDLEGDAIGGTLNLIMKDAPDSTLFRFNIGTGYSHYLFSNPFTYWKPSQLGDDPAQTNGQDYLPSVSDFSKEALSPDPGAALPFGIFGISYGRRTLKNKLGFIVNASWQNTSRETRSIVYETATDIEGKPTYTNVMDRSYSNRLSRGGVNLRLDYKLSEKSTLNLSSVYMNLNEYQYRIIHDTSLNSNRTIPGTGNISVTDRIRKQQQTIWSNALQGKHTLSKEFKTDWSLVYATAAQNTPDRTEVLRDYSILNPPGTDDSARFFSVTHDWQKNKDQDYAAYLNLSWTPQKLHNRIEFKLGGMTRYKERVNTFNDYLITLKTDAKAPYYTSLADVPDSIQTVYYNPANSVTGSNNYTARELVSAYYYSFRYNMPRWNVIAGIRTEFTLQEFETKAPLSFTIPNGANVNYADVLPSINAKYLIKKNQNLRLAWFQSISRPSYFELVPYVIVDEQFVETGNPYLKHTQANNFDVRYEIYPGNRDQFMFGAFHKYLRNPVEYGFTDQSADQLAPQNFGDATNVGLEFVAVKFIGAFGMSGNYTFTHSEITTDKIYNDFQNQQTILRPETRSLQGQSKHIGNLSVFYKPEDKGTHIQLSGVYTGRRISQVAIEYGLDFWQKAFIQLDFSVEQKFMDHWTAYAKINNLLNSPYQVELNDGTLVQEDTYGQVYFLGVRYTLN